MARRDPLLGLLLALFGLMALGAAVLAIVNVTTGRVLLQNVDLGMLKTLGFTPLQVLAMLTAEHAVLAGAGIIAGGLAAARLLTPPPARSRAGRQRGLGRTAELGWAFLITAGTFAAVLLATSAPALRAGMVRPVAAVRAVPPRGHLSKLASMAMAARMPPAMVLGTQSRIRAQALGGADDRRPGHSDAHDHHRPRLLVDYRRCPAKPGRHRTGGQRHGQSRPAHAGPGLRAGSKPIRRFRPPTAASGPMHWR